jgi:hypothetical protein
MAAEVFESGDFDPSRAAINIDGRTVEAIHTVTANDSVSRDPEISQIPPSIPPARIERGD